MLAHPLSKLRLMSLVAVVFSFVGAALTFLIGAYQVCIAVWLTFWGAPPTDRTRSDAAILLLISSLDSFLIGMALLYFAHGIYALMSSPPGTVADSDTPQWLVPRSLADLKRTLAQVILVILFVLFLDVAWMNLHTPRWEILAMPGATVLLAVALKIMDLGGGQS